MTDVAITSTGSVWASTVDLRDRVRLGRLTSQGLQFVDYPRTPEALGTIVPRTDGGFWFIASPDTVVSVGASDQATTYGPLAGEIDSAILNPDNSLSVAAGLSVHNSALTTIGVDGTVTSTALPIPAPATDSCLAGTVVDINHASNGATWVVDHGCERLFLRQASGLLTPINTSSPGTIALDNIAAAAAAPDGSLWLLGTSEHRWSLRDVTTSGEVTTFALPPPPRIALDGYNSLYVAPDGTPWIGVSRSCAVEYLDNGVLHATRTPFPEANLSFSLDAPFVWLWNATKLTHVPMSQLEGSGFRCVARVPHIRLVDQRSTVTLRSLEDNGLAVSVDMSSVVWGDLVVTAGRGNRSVELGETASLPRLAVGPDRGRTVTFRFSRTLLSRARGRLARGFPVFIAPGLVHAENADGVSGYLQSGIRVIL